MLYHAQLPFWRRHPVVTSVAVFLAGWLLVDGWYLTVALAAGAVLLLAIRRTRRARRFRHAGLRARAEFEHRLAQWGDQRGVFGRYPPVQAGWFPDPANRWQWRYFDGSMWTNHAAR
ncbi:MULTISPECIES: DUF2510 domain-containing protein [unclassified Mycobacterium]|uniref:DUF2510 domain-containing protein n=1 Tax=unclassified Mycobacterium TaxID=2642494 RepID=UPI0029C8FF88|nr:MULTISPECIES: DUF2510 domain-containing protein [unclassified Mycobacterium]